MDCPRPLVQWMGLQDVVLNALMVHGCPRLHEHHARDNAVSVMLVYKGTKNMIAASESRITKPVKATITNSLRSRSHVFRLGGDLLSTSVKPLLPM